MDSVKKVSSYVYTILYYNMYSTTKFVLKGRFLNKCSILCTVAYCPNSGTQKMSWYYLI